MSDEWLSITDQQLHDRTIAAGENESGGTRGSASGFFATIFETMAVLFAYAWRVAIRPIATHIDPRVAKGFFLATARSDGWHALPGSCQDAGLHDRGERRWRALGQ